VAQPRHLTEGRWYNALLALEIHWLGEVVEETEVQVDHCSAARTDLRSPAKTGEIVSDIAVVLLDPEGQALVGSWAGEELGRGDASMVAVPVVGQEDPALESDFIEELLAGWIVTLTQNPSPPARSR